MRGIVIEIADQRSGVVVALLLSVKRCNFNLCACDRRVAKHARKKEKIIAR